jgi:predicted cobalt transporter CbtA
MEMLSTLVFAAVIAAQFAAILVSRSTVASDGQFPSSRMGRLTAGFDRRSSPLPALGMQPRLPASNSRDRRTGASKSRAQPNVSIATSSLSPGLRAR